MVTKRCPADGSACRQPEALPSIAVASLRPALASIPGACRYLGDPSRAKFYADLLPELDVVKLGARTFVTIESLDRLVALNTQPAGQRSDRDKSGERVRTERHRDGHGG